MHSYTTDAIILKRFNLGEADRVLTLLTRERGRVAAIGRGVRKPTSRLGGHLELFAHTNLTLGEGKTFDTITSADLKEPHAGLAVEVERINAAHYVAEAVLKLTIEAQEVDRLFELVAATFASLARAHEAAGILAGFQLKLLTLLGHRPVLDQCVHCQETFTSSSVIPDRKSRSAGRSGSGIQILKRVQDDSQNPGSRIKSGMTKPVAGFDSIHGGLVCQDCSTGLHHPIVQCDAAGQGCLRALLLEPLSETRVADPGFRTATGVIEQALLHQTERPLKSRAFVALTPTVINVD